MGSGDPEATHRVELEADTELRCWPEDKECERRKGTWSEGGMALGRRSTPVLTANVLC